MKAPRLKQGGMIGICSPSHIASYDDYQRQIACMKNCGFQVREANNLYKATYGYGASPEERAADFNQLIADPEVELILFGGGEGANELLPFIDFENIKRNPKRICSYSDGTFLLNPIWAQTGLETYYGQAPHLFLDMSDYDAKHFWGHLVHDDMKEHVSNSEWKVQHNGVGEGILIGGYARNFALNMSSPYLPLDMNENYVLFIEDHESFGGIDYVSAMLTHIEQGELMKRVTGILLGNYGTREYPELLARLKRMGEAHQIPVIYCDDFGHGWNHAILPIGRKVKLDANEKKLIFI